MSRSFYKSAFFAATALSGALAIPTAAKADDPAPTEVIVVTARRVEEKLQDVPASITVFNQRQLTNLNITYAGDIAAFTPSLTVSNQFGNEASTFILRGFSQDIGTSPTVGTYFADVIQPRGGFGGTTIHAGEGTGPGSLFDLETVQVLKGPQGTLFGRNTTGGAVLLVPKKPTREFDGYVEASFGNYGMERGQGVANVPVNEKLQVRVGFDAQKRDGYLVNVSGIGPSSMSDIDYMAGRLSVVADITDDIENYTIGSFTRSDNHGWDTQMVACNKANQIGSFFACPQLTREGANRDPYTVDNSLFNARSFLQQWQIINNTTWDVNDAVTIKNIASYAELQASNESSLFGDNFEFGKYHIMFTAEGTPPDTFLTNQLTFTEELRFQGRALDGKLDWQGGLYMEGSHPLGLSGSSGPNYAACANYQLLDCSDPFGTPGHPIGNVGRRYGEVTWRNYGIYFQDTYAITDELKLETGIRYTMDSTSGHTFRDTYYFPKPNMPAAPVCEPPLSPNTPSCLVSDHESSRAPTGMVDLRYEPIQDLSVYVKYARGYRQGGLLSTGPIDNTTFQPEQVNAYELGVKAAFQGEVSGFLNGAFFYNDFSNQQLLGTFVNSNLQGSAPNAGILNVGSSQIWGFELEGTIKPTRDLTFSLGYSYLNSRLNQVTNQAPAGNFYNVFGPNERVGQQLAFTPRNKLSLTATYQLPLDESVGKVSVSGTYSYTSSQLVYGDGPYAYLQPINLLNFNLNWESIYGHPIDAEFFMTNVTDLKYSTYNDNFYYLYGFVAETLGPPRMFGGRLRYHF